MVQPADERFDSWKSVAEYLRRDVRTVARWEREKGLPVHRVPGGKRRAIFAYRAEIDAWLAREQLEPPEQTPPPAPWPQPTNAPVFPQWSTRLSVAVLIGAGAIVAGSLLLRGTGAAKPDSIPLSAMPSRIPAGVLHWARITVVNRQPAAASSPFPLMVRLDPSRYLQFEAGDLSNIEFFGARGQIVPSWRESGAGKLSRSAIYWLLLRNGLPEAAEKTIYVGFAAPDRSLLNGADTGEAPALSPQYGEFDNGARVFARYANFAGPSLPRGWYRNADPSGQPTVRIHDGIFLAHAGTGGGVVALGSDWAVGSLVAEVDLLGKYTNNAQAMALVCSSSPTRFRWTPDSVGFQNMSGLEIEDNLRGAPSVVLRARDSTSPAVLGVAGPMLYSDYRPAALAPRRICGGDFLAVAADSGFSAWLSFDWVRLRARPPLDVMPTALVGPAH